MEPLDSIDAHWIWLTLGVLLAGLEMVVPGVYLIWLAGAAIITGALTYVLGLSPTIQVIDFVFLSMIIVFSVRRWLRDQPIVSSDPLLNRRGARLVGQTALVAEAIEDGSGRVRVGDGEWLARGPDMPVGARVRIAATEGTVLIVEAIAHSPEEGPEGKGGLPAA